MRNELKEEERFGGGGEEREREGTKNTLEEFHLSIIGRIYGTKSFLAY